MAKCEKRPVEPQFEYHAVFRENEIHILQAILGKCAITEHTAAIHDALGAATGLAHNQLRYVPVDVDGAILPTIYLRER